jgi:hypothetical protein
LKNWYYGHKGPPGDGDTVADAKQDGLNRHVTVPPRGNWSELIRVPKGRKFHSIRKDDQYVRIGVLIDDNPDRNHKRWEPVSPTTKEIGNLYFSERIRKEAQTIRITGDRRTSVTVFFR